MAEIEHIEMEYRKVYEWIITELRAGMVLEPKDEADRMWNHCTLRAISIVRKYEQGIGLFQLTNESIERKIDEIDHGKELEKFLDD